MRFTILVLALAFGRLLKIAAANTEPEPEPDFVFAEEEDEESRSRNACTTERFATKRHPFKSMCGNMCKGQCIWRGS